MEIIDRINRKYDPDTRRGLINNIVNYIKEEDARISCMGLIRTMYYLSIGRLFEPENDYVLLYRYYWEEEERLERLKLGEGVGDMDCDSDSDSESDSD